MTTLSLGSEESYFRAWQVQYKDLSPGNLVSKILIQMDNVFINGRKFWYPSLPNINEVTRFLVSFDEIREEVPGFLGFGKKIRLTPKADLLDIEARLQNVPILGQARTFVPEEFSGYALIYDVPVGVSTKETPYSCRREALLDRIVVSTIPLDLSQCLISLKNK